MLEGINILAVDDDEMSLEMLVATLGSRGAICTKAVNGREAMEALESNPDIDIMLLDLEMPVMKGLEVLHQCKGNPYIIDIPVIVLAADHQEKLKSLQLGADDFMGKPYSLNELELRISKRVQTRRQTQAAKQAKCEFLSIASHELRTPLHQIMGLSELLNNEALGNEQRELMEMLKAATVNLTNTVKDILDFVRLDQNAVCATTEPFSLRATLQNALEAQEDRAHKKGIKLGLSIADDVSDALIGPSFSIRRVLDILLENAIKFSSDGEINIVMREAPCERSASHFYCSISDQGISIPAELHEKIFEPFAQVDSSDSRRFNGIGLGLAIALGLAEQMGGTITVHNNEASGSSFNFSFYCHLKQP